MQRCGGAAGGGGEGGWKQNRTALTTEPKDKEKIGLADRKKKEKKKKKRGSLGGSALLHEG